MKKIILILICLYSLGTNAQPYLISFAGIGASTSVTSVKVENLTQGTYITLNGGEILRLTGTVGIRSNRIDQPSGLKIYPNPATENSFIEVNSPVAGDAVIEVYDMTGRKLFQSKFYFDKYLQKLSLSGLNKGTYVINVKGNNYNFTGKYLSARKTKGIVNIERVSSNIPTSEMKFQNSDVKGIQSTVDMNYFSGDRLKFTGCSGIYSTVLTDIPASDKTITFNYIPCTDGDNNNYPIVQIGNQVWMAENLKTTKFNDGADIPLVKIDTWGIPGFRWYNDDAATNKTTYGALYNWFTVNTGKVCPIGWRVPTDAEWYTLASTIDPEAKPNLTIESYMAGGKLKETGLTHWQSPNTGATNESGFTALPGGYFGYFSFFNIGEGANWWSATQDIDDFFAWNRYLVRTESHIERFKSPKLLSYSVRCIKDN